MNAIPRCLSCLVAAAALLMGAADANAQFTRPSYNPYKPFQAGGAYLPGMPGFSNQSIIFGRFGTTGPVTISFPSQYGRLTVPYNPNFPFYLNSPLGPTYSYAPTGYTYGGADSSYGYGREQIVAAPARQDMSHKAFDRWIIERERARRPDAFAPNKDEELARALTNPSQGDITSGAALNTIVDALAGMTARLKDAPQLALDEAFLKKLNFTRGTGSVGALFGGGKIDWPMLLLNLEPKTDVAKVRQPIEERFQTAFNQVNAGGKLDPDNARALLKLIDNLSDMASARAHAMTFAENLEVKRYLKGLEDGVAFLKQADAADWMPGRQKAKPATVQELVQLMADKGVRFAPALLGNDAAYLALHRALVRLHAQVAPPQVGAKRP